MKRKINGIVAFYTSQKIKYTFMPEHTPNFDGLWETVVKAFKVHIRKVLVEVRLKFKEFTTILTQFPTVQVEGCLNSRVLTPILDAFAAKALKVLTPGGLLT